MDREQIEIKYLELLNTGADPLTDPDVQRAVSEDPSFAGELAALGRMLGILGDASRPYTTPTVSSDTIDAITTSFEEGYQQGRRAAIQRPARRGGSAWLPVAAVAAAVAAFVFGAAWQRSAHSPADMATLQQNPATLERTTLASEPALVENAPGKRAELNDVRGEVAELRQMVALSLLQNRSAAKRIEGVRYATAIDAPDEQLIDALETTLRNDESVTVRLASADALTQYGNTLPSVRLAIVNALLAESDPLVQLQLIDLLMGVRDAETLNALRALSDEPDTDTLVRERAHWALKEMN